jgi:hypothetical protein
MGVLYDYFAAASDERAAAAIDLTGGPGGAMPIDPKLVAAMRAGDREALKRLTTPQARWSEYGLQVLQVKGVDPVVQLGMLEELLTGVGFDDIIAGPRSGVDLAVRDGGERVVANFVRELVRLAREALGRGDRLCCWVSL